MKPSFLGSPRLFGSPAILLVILVWCTTLTVASIRPTRTVKRTVEVEPALIEEDQCASFSTDLGKELKKLLNLGWMEDAHDIDMCLCNSTVADFVSHSRNRQIEIARAMVGKAKVQNALETLISRNRPKVCSALPTHATRTCEAGSHPCGFSCKSPYRKAAHGNTCVLPASPSARPRKRSYEEQSIFAGSSCKPHERICARNGNGNSGSSRTPPLSSRFDSGQFECIDVTRDLFNCGGCAAASLGLQGEVLGVDCSDLPGVSDVKCVTGRCNVTRCGLGWSLNPLGDGCIRTMM